MEGFQDRRKGKEKVGKEDVGKVARVGGRKGNDAERVQKDKKLKKKERGRKDEGG